MATNIKKIKLNKKKQLEISQKRIEVGRAGISEPFGVKSKGDLYEMEIHRDLEMALFYLVPHTMFSTSFVTKEVAIPVNIKDEEWFTGGHFQDDERFNNIEVVGVEILGKDGVDGVKLSAIKSGEFGESKWNTPPIYFDRGLENAYPLISILSAQIETLLFEVDKYMEGKNASSNQLSLWKDEKVA